MSAAPQTAEAGQATLAQALLFVVPLCFVTNPIVSKMFIQDIPPWAMGFWRWCGAALIIAPFAAGALWRGRAAVPGEAPRIAILGFLGVTAAGGFVYVGALTTSAVNIGLIFSASPVFVVVLARLLYGQAMTRGQTAGVIVSLLGVLLILSRGQIETFAAARFVVGDLWLLVASLAWALYSLLHRRWKSALPEWPRFLAIMIAGVILLAPFAIWERAAGRDFALSTPNLVAIFVLALVPGALAYAGYNYISGKLGPARASMLLYMVPVYAAILAWIVLGERIGWYHVAGAALVIAGIYASLRLGPKPPVPGK